MHLPNLFLRDQSGHSTRCGCRLARRLSLGWLLSFIVVLAVEKPIGTFASAGANGNPTDSKTIYGDPNLRGVLIRVGWDAIEPTPGSYTFSSLTSQINNVKSKGLSWSLGVVAGGTGSPGWLTNPTTAGGAGAPFINYSFRGVPGYKLPLFWHATVQTRLQLLASALAAQYNNDASLKLVYIPQMTSNGIEGHLQGVNMADLTAAGYTDANWISAAKSTARNFALAFTNKALAFEVHYVNNGATVPGTIINDLWDDPSLGQRVGAAMWWISGRTNYQPDLIAVLMDYPGDIYGQVIANSATTTEFADGDYTTVFTQAKMLGMRYIEPWDYEFTDSPNSAHRAWNALFSDFNLWADANFESGGGSSPPGATPPGISTQPVSQSVATGGSVTFTVTATGTTPLTYQWRFGGMNIPGATGSSLTLSNVQTADAGPYTVTVSNNVSSVSSNAATLTVTVRITPPASPTTSGGGGGAPSIWFLSVLALLSCLRLLPPAYHIRA